MLNSYIEVCELRYRKTWTSKFSVTFHIEVTTFDIELVLDIEAFNVKVELRYQSFELQYRGGKDQDGCVK
jgi:hypothetical protein